MADNAFSVNADGNSSGTADWGATCSRKGGSRKSDMEKLAGYCLLTFALLGALIRSVYAEPVKSRDFLFEAVPPVIVAGETATLRWSIKGATQVVIDEASTASRELHKLGTFGPSGSIQVQPREDTTYVVSCEGSTTYSCASLTIRVQVKRP